MKSWILAHVQSGRKWKYYLLINIYTEIIRLVSQKIYPNFDFIVKDINHLFYF